MDKLNRHMKSGLSSNRARPISVGGECSHHWAIRAPMKIVNCSIGSAIKFAILLRINRIHKHYILRTEREARQPHQRQGSQLPQLGHAHQLGQASQARGQVNK